MRKCAKTCEAQNRRQNVGGGSSREMGEHEAHTQVLCEILGAACENGKIQELQKTHTQNGYTGEITAAANTAAANTAAANTAPASARREEKGRRVRV